MSATVFQKIGRNVFYLQKIEGMLKVLVAQCDVSSTASEIVDLIRQLHQPSSKKTLGGLLTEFFERLYSDIPDPERPKGTDGSWLAFGFRLGSSDDAIQKEVSLFTEVLNERNHLIHHELPFCTLQTQHECSQLAARLDDQLVNIATAHEILSEHLAFVNEMKSQLPDILRQVIDHEQESDLQSSVVRS
ncbi:hypothetical protein [Stieleria sedimenti]|uniref:hypothetical protein n=1 Tax=Stieleria sedimenti TaxID=2976331 RepID=UPI00217FDC77|nr:hypothetical protein [Stieleria sedimenti]